ncbi:hypothetical protein CPB83DRAFT_109740 [Crepidotus variabilis]|uniref:Uncharacterized protein n=1 Tax=Crepidotus variabilis TaxID=179855 RepID=A0A9P6JT70_9AGAR|nr:hypothetical protein CPB83DRAFT_109740 [Crepidotus variabilis]
MQYSRNNAASSNRSWVYPYNQSSAPLPAPQPLNLPPAVHDHEHLPNPYPSRQHHAQHGLRVVNNTPDIEEHRPIEDDSYMPVDYQPPKKKKSIFGKMFKGAGRIPEVLGYGVGAGLSDKRKMKRMGTLDDGYGSSTVTRTDTLPRYTSPSSSSQYEQPHSTLGLNFHPQHHPVDTTIDEYPEFEETHTPPPDVVRLSDTVPPPVPLRASRSRRVPPPSVDTFEDELNIPGGLTASRYMDHPATETFTPGNPVERTTVMVYDRDSRYPDPAPLPLTPPPVSRPVSSGPGLSYATPDPLPPPPLQPLRPISVVLQPPVPAPATVEVTPPVITSTNRLSHRTPTGPRPLSIVTTPLNANPLPPSQTTAPGAAISVTTNPVPVTPAQPQNAFSRPQDIMSPVSAQPFPTTDYMKMTHSPSSHHTGTASSPTTFSLDPSFSSDLSPFVRFVRTLYHMPWISHDRVTVDYLPNEGVIGLRQKATRKRAKSIPWYNALGERGRRDSGSVELLSGHKGLGKHDDRKTSISKPRKHGKSGGYMRTRRRHHHHHHHSSSSKRRHHHGHESHRHTSSTENVPLPPTSPMYSFPYSPYPYAPYPGFPVPAIAGGQTPPSPKGAQATVQTSPHGVYPPYQPLMAPPHMYFFAQPQVASPSGKQNVPAVLVPGAVDHDHARHKSISSAKTAGTSVVPPVLIPGVADEEHKDTVKLSSASQKTNRQSVPGAFA